MLYMAAGFWSWGTKDLMPAYVPIEEGILAFMEGFELPQVIGIKTQLLLTLQLPVLVWMFEGKVLSTHHATDVMWSKWTVVISEITL